VRKTNRGIHLVRGVDLIGVLKYLELQLLMSINAKYNLCCAHTMLCSQLKLEQS